MGNIQDGSDKDRASSEVEIEQVRSISIQGCPQDKKRPFPENRRCRDKRRLGTATLERLCDRLVPETYMGLRHKAVNTSLSPCETAPVNRPRGQMNTIHKRPSTHTIAAKKANRSPSATFCSPLRLWNSVMVAMLMLATIEQACHREMTCNNSKSPK